MGMGQTGNGSIFLPVIDWFVPFSQAVGFSRCRKQWWRAKCLHFLCRSPNRKCQYFPACYWLIHIVFTGRGLLEMPNTMVIIKIELVSYQSITGSKMLVFLVWRAKQELTTFQTFPLYSASRATPFSENGMYQSITGRKMLSLPVWRDSVFCFLTVLMQNSICCSTTCPR